MIKKYLQELNIINDNKNLLDMKTYALENKFPIIEEEGISFIEQLISIGNIKNILEIGTAIGYSSIRMALQGCNVDTIEIDKKTSDIARHYVTVNKLDDKIRVIQGDALEIDLRILREEYDMIFIDASKSQYIKFCEKYSCLLKTNGIIISDNLLFHDLVVENIKEKNLRQLVTKIKKFNSWIVVNEDYNSRIYNVGDGICVSIKKV